MCLHRGFWYIIQAINPGKSWLSRFPKLLCTAHETPKATLYGSRDSQSYSTAHETPKATLYGSRDSQSYSVRLTRLPKLLRTAHETLKYTLRGSRDFQSYSEWLTRLSKQTRQYWFHSHLPN